MKPIRMIHPRHGAMHVYDEDQKQAHEKLGWKVEAEDLPATQEAQLAAIPKRAGRPRKAA